MTETLIILAAGASSRMKKTLAQAQKSDLMPTNKALIPLGTAKIPALDFLLNNVVKAGFKDVVLVVSPGSEEFKERYGQREHGNLYRGLRIAYAYQYLPNDALKPMGTADALLQALQQYPKLSSTSFVLCNADNLYSIKALTLLRQCDAPNALMSYDRDALKFPITKIRAFALLVVNENKELLQLEEKPNEEMTGWIQERMNRLLVSMNLWKFNGSDIIRALRVCPIHPIRQEKELPMAAQILVKDLSCPIQVLEIAEHVPDLTAASDIALVEKQLGLHH